VSTPNTTNSTNTTTSWRPWLLVAGLLVLTLAAYHPAWHGGLLWDDEAHLTPVALQSAHGLWRIWFEIGATQQYYPATHSAFWLLHAIAGSNTFWYHIVNISLHACSAFFVAVILRRLAIPGAVLAAVIFALHPVHVESVAWIAELKNTLSGACYLAAMWAYLRFDENRGRRWYALSLALFVVALLSKTVTATLPAALLVIFWWQRGRLDWKRDVQPLVPFLLLGAALGLLTAWVERAYIGAQGSDFQLTLVDRTLVAGRAVWFYMATLAWPSDLILIYPRWRIDRADWVQLLYPLAALVLLAVLWGIRHRTRAPLAAFLFFCGTLVPALGFVDVYPFRYSFVADHFQYLASLGIIVLFAAAVASLLARIARPRKAVAMTAVTVLFAATLGLLTWRQSHQYADSETLYRATIARDPSSWMAHNNLGVVLLRGAPGRLAEATGEFRESLRLNPDNAEAHHNMGVALQRTNRLTEAAAENREAIRLIPMFAEAHNDLGVELAGLGRMDQAIEQYRAALRIQPAYVQAHINLGVTLAQLGRLGDALPELEAVLALQPESSQAHNNLGYGLMLAGRREEAEARFNEALRLDPGNAQARANLARVKIK